MPGKGYRNVGLREEVIQKIERHLKKSEIGKLFPRRVSTFIHEAIEGPLNKGGDGRGGDGEKEEEGRR